MENTDLHPLRAWRRDNQVTQEKLAERLGVFPSHISQIEKRKRGASRDLAIHIEEITGGRVRASDLKPAAEAAPC